MPTPLHTDDLYPWDPNAPLYLTTTHIDHDPTVPTPGLPFVILSIDLPYISVAVLTTEGIFDEPRILDSRTIKFMKYDPEFVRRIQNHIQNPKVFPTSSPHEYPTPPVLPPAPGE